MAAVSLTVPSPVPTVIGAVVAPLPPVATTWPLTRSSKTPGSEAGTTTLRNWTVAVQRSELDDAVAVRPDNVQVRLVLSASKGVLKTPTKRPGSNTFGCPRSCGAGVKPLRLPTGIVIGSEVAFR